MKTISKLLITGLCLVAVMSACGRNTEKPDAGHTTSPAVRAVMKSAPARPPEAALYRLDVAAGVGGTVTVEGGDKTVRSYSANLASGAKIKPSATPDEGYIFSHWEFSSGSFDNRFSSTSVFTMPEADTHTYAYFRKTNEEIKPLPAYASSSPLEVVSGYMETWRNEGLLSLETYESAINEEGTKKLISRFTGSDHALRSGWSDEYIKENLLCVAVHYSAKYDHQKTFHSDGEFIRSIYLSRDVKSGLWTFWNNDGGIEISAFVNGHEPWPDCMKIRKALGE